MGQTYLAEEAVQEGFLALWRNPWMYEEVLGSVRAWLMATVHHRAVDLVRREEAQRRRAQESAPDDALALADDPADEVVDEIGLPEERKAVPTALDDLPAEHRQIIEPMYFDGLSQSTIPPSCRSPSAR